MLRVVMAGYGKAFSIIWRLTALDNTDKQAIIEEVGKNTKLTDTKDNFIQFLSCLLAFCDAYSLYATKLGGDFKLIDALYSII